MADQIQFRGGPSSTSASFTGAAREITVDTTLNTLRVHDGTSAGGHILAKETDLATAEGRATALETAQAAILTALGISSGAANLGTFSGTTLADASSLKTLLQAIETALENKATLLGMDVGSTHLGAFSGSTIADNVAVKTALQSLETATELRATIANPAFTGNLLSHIGDSGSPVVHRIAGGFPDFQMSSAGERRLLFSDAGNGGEGAVKFSSNTMTFFTGGISASEERLRITSAGRVGIGETNPAAQLHVGGSVLVKADFPDFQMRSGGERRVIFEDAGGGAEGAIKFASSTMKFFAGGIASSDELLSLNASGVEFPGTKVEIAKDAFGLRLERISNTQFDIGTANPGSGYNLNIKNSNGTDARVVVYSDLFWVRGLGGNSGNGNVKFDGTLDFDDVTLTGIQTSSESFSDDDVSLMTSAAINDLVATATTTLADLGITSTATELNLLDGVTATTAELNLLDGVTATTAELNYVDGVTSAIQTQLDGKYATSGGELTGSVTITTGFPDMTLKSNGERRVLFQDAGGSVDAGLKYASSALQFVYGGVASGDIEMKVEDAKVTIVNELALPGTVSAAAATDITIVDNTADAFEIKEGSNQYIAITSTDSAEKVEVFKNLHLAGERLFFDTGTQLIRLSDNKTSALKIENHDGSHQDYLDFKTANSGAELIFGAPNQFNNTITVGADDTGHDVILYGATSGAYLQWDESADALLLVGSATLDIAGDIDVDGTSNLDVLDVDGTANFASTIEANGDLTMKANINFTGSGREIRFKNNTYNALRFQKEDGTTYMGFDSQGDATIFFSQPLDVNTSMQIDGTVTVGVDDTGYDVKFFGATASAYMLWDESEDDLILGGAAGLIVPDGQLTLGSTAVTSTAAELNILDGVTSTAAELNILDGVTSTAAELNLLDGVTATTAELNYVDGVTSNIQTQLDAKLASTGAQAALHVDHIITLTGVAEASDNLGTFTGSTISDNQTIKAAIQAVETAVETKQAADADLTNLAGCQSGASAAIAALTQAEVEILDGATVTTAELNILDGVTATTAEINVLDGPTAGTVSASKAVVVDSNKDITGFRNVTATGTLTVDSVGVSAIQTSGESFADNDTSLMTSAAIDDRIAAAAATESSGTATLTFNGFSTNPDPKLTVTAYYCKVGKMVTITFSTSQNYSGYAGSATITGLPFAANSNADFYGTAHHDGSLNTSLNDGIIARIRGAANTTIDFLGQESNLQVSWSGTNATKVLNTTITYFTA